METPAIDLINERTIHHYPLTWREVHIPMRDGSYLAANLYQPDADGQFPTIASLCPYGKDLHFTEFAPANPTIVPEYAHSQDKGPLISWEATDPDFWVPQGYAVLRIDERGIGRSPGVLDLLSESTKHDYYDAIEWVAAQPWSNGKTGLLGVSYLAMSQWAVASEQPPHLTCIIPWEGSVDYYADFAYPGGILANGFLDFWFAHGVLENQYNPDHAFSPEQLQANRVDFPAFARHNPLRNEAWARHSADLSKVEVPFLSASNWFSAGIHTRGNFRAFQQAASPHKWLTVHVGSHVGEFYAEGGRALQKQFFDFWLRGIDTGLLAEPRVKVALPTGGSNFTWRYEDEYPLRRTQWQPFYLDAASGQLGSEPWPAAAQASYQGDHDRESAHWAHPYLLKPFSKSEVSAKRLLFETPPFAAETVLMGPMKLRLWVSSTQEDLDVFVSLRHLDAHGQEVVNRGSNTANFPISQGWLRASLRKLDPAQSTPTKPYYAYDEVQPLVPGQPYPLEIELWDSAMLVPAGHSLLLEVGSQNQSGCGITTQWAEDRTWDADATLYTGGEYDSHLLLPIIPPAA